MLMTSFPWLLVTFGLLGVVLGVDRTLKRRENESKLLQVIAFLAGLVLFAIPVVMVLQGGQGIEISGLSILLILLLAICLVGRALKRLPLAFVIVTVMGTGLFWMTSVLKQVSFAGDIPSEAKEM